MPEIEQVGIKPKKTAAENISTLGGFLAGGLAACGAVTFTNPIELIKTRMQLQGELSKNSNVPKLYKNPLQAFALIYKNEGIRGLQQGLACGYYYQLGLNGCRIGLYEPSRYFITRLLMPSSVKDGQNLPQYMTINVLAGFVSGAAGAVIASPFFLIKTRMQSYSGGKAASSEGVQNFGQQTYYKNAWDGLLKIYKSEGSLGLFRGVDAAILRTGAGSAAQLPVYNATKSILLEYDVVEDKSTGLHFISGVMAGLGVAIVMNPWDVILTRVYNQKGDLYRGPLDCFSKTVSAEGFGALYKGFYAQLFRIWPHSILTLMFMEHCMNAIEKIEKKLSN